MKYCTGKCGLITICVAQLIATIERQVFDFLGFMWLPIIANFLQLVAVIFGFFGAYQQRVRYLAVYAVWSVIWLGWNVFVLCFYLEVGTLRHSDELLSLYTGAAPFWFASGPGCVPVYAGGAAPEEVAVGRPPRPLRVDGCWLDGPHVEALHAALHVALAVLGLILALCLIIARRREDDSSGVKPRSLSPAYHIEYRPHRLDDRPASPPLAIASSSTGAGAMGAMGAVGGAVGGAELMGAVGPAPMTPRKIKRRAMGRSSQRSSGRSQRSGRSRSSQRQRRHANPVTQLLDSSSSEPAPERGHTNAGFLSSEPPRPPSVHSSYSNYHGQRRAHVSAHVASHVSGHAAHVHGHGSGHGHGGHSGAHGHGAHGHGSGHGAHGQVAVASDYGTTGTLSASSSGYVRRPVPAPSSHYGSEYSDYGRAGPPPYEAVQTLHTETSM